MRVLSLIGVVCACLFCLPQKAAALQYGSPYMGTTYSAASHSRYNTGMAQAPTASMRSTSAWAGSTMQSSMSNGAMATMNSAIQVRGISTSASAIRGGVTTYDSHPRRGISGPRRGPEQADDDDCGCVDHIINETGEEGEDGLCDYCWHEIGDCTCDPCRCPIELDFKALLFMATLAGAYAVYKRKGHPTRTSTMRT